MKSILSAAVLMFFIVSCQSQPSAYKEAVKTKNAIEAMRPGFIATSAGGFTMTAKVDGQSWKATSMAPVESSGRIAGYTGKQYISLPRFERKFLRIGQKEVFGETNVAELAIGEDPVYCSALSGEVEITKIEGSWIEAKFFVTAKINGSSKTIVIKDGFVRVNYEK